MHIALLLATLALAGKPMDLKLEVQLSYGPAPDAVQGDAPVLWIHVTYRNVSRTETYRLDFSDGALGVESAGPPSRIEVIDDPAPPFRRSPPSPESIVTLRPGESHAGASWHWAARQLPWRNVEGTKGYLVRREGPIELVFCRTFDDTRRVCSKAVHLDVRIFTKHE